MKRDITDVIENHHRVLELLIGRLLVLQSSPAYRLLFDEFAKGLGALLRATDQAIIPQLRHYGWKQVSSQLLQEHVELKHQLGVLLTLCPDTPAQAAALHALASKLRRQRELAAEQLLPWLEETLDEGRREQLGVEVQEHLSCLLGEERRDFDESEPAADLVEQAKLVLGSFRKAQ